MVRVTFKDARLRQFTLDVSKTDTVSSVKQTISSNVNIPPNKQKLIYKGRELLDQELLSEISEGAIIYVLTNNSNIGENNITNPFQALMSDNNFLKMTLESNSYLKNICQDNPEISRAVNDLISDPQTLIQAAKAAVNPSMARELARTTDRAVQNVETIPGGFQALYNLHTKLQDPLWNAASCAFNDESPITAKIYNDDRLAPLEANPLPNPWKKSTGSSNQSQTSYIPTNQNTQNQMPLVPMLNYTDGFYSHQADLLVQMGFTDHAKCLAALEQAQGDISTAIDILTQPESTNSQN